MERFSTWLRNIWIVLGVAGVILALDVWTKTLVRANLEKYVDVPVLGDYLALQQVDNYGAAFGIFQNARLVLTVVAITVSIAILIYVAWVPTNKRLLLVLLGLQLGGALGNLIDRVSRGYVTDFVKMGIPGVYYWPNWNVADAAIVIGVIALALYIIVEDISAARRARQEGQEGQAAGE